VIVYVTATAILWALSGVLAVGLGLLLAAASLSSRLSVRLLGGSAVTLTRGVPTSLLVVAGGIVAIRLPPSGWVPNLFPGTPGDLRMVAAAVTVALAVGSTGHFAVIFQAAHAALGRYRIEQTTVLGLAPLQRTALLAREAALIALPPTGARLVHHLHNTAFAALFPVADLFGWIQEQASATFEVTRYALLGAGAYVGLSGLVWAGCKALELRLAVRPARPPSRLPAAPPNLSPTPSNLSPTPSTRP